MNTVCIYFWTLAGKWYYIPVDIPLCSETSSSDLEGTCASECSEERTPDRTRHYHFHEPPGLENKKNHAQSKCDKDEAERTDFILEFILV